MSLLSTFGRIREDIFTRVYKHASNTVQYGHAHNSKTRHNIYYTTTVSRRNPRKFVTHKTLAGIIYNEIDEHCARILPYNVFDVVVPNARCGRNNSYVSVYTIVNGICRRDVHDIL